MADSRPSSGQGRRGEPTWVEHAVWWHLYPLGFVGASTTESTTTVQHRLGAIGDWIAYAVELGASGILLGPVFSSETHGYDTVDYLSIDPRLGDEQDFRDLVDRAHAAGLRVLLDGVFNHVGRSFPGFQSALAGGPESAWFRRSGGDDAHPRFDTFEGHDALVAFDHEEPAVAELVARVMDFWLSLGADGWRLDAAYAVPPAFWADVLPRVRQRHPEAYIVGEVIHGDYAEMVLDSTMDSVTQYELWKSIRNSLAEGNFFELDWTLQRHNDLLESFVPLTFVGNHDVTRIADAVGDPSHLAHALVVLFTVGGTPAIYYGDEQAFTGVKEERAGGDDAVRPAFPADRASLAPEGWPVFHLHQELIGLRRRHPWLHAARTSSLHLANTFTVYETTQAGERLVVALNIGTESAEFAIDALEVLAGVARFERRDDTSVLVVPAHGWVVLG